MAGKKKYVKPVVQDLGSIMITNAQTPMGLCQHGTSPSGAGSECETGGSVTACSTGGLHDISSAWCLDGNVAAGMCSTGSTPS